MKKTCHVTSDHVKDVKRGLIGTLFDYTIKSI